MLIIEADLAELAELVPTARAVEVEAFVEGGEISPLSLSGVSYFVVPDNKVKGSAKPYRLLADAMRLSAQSAWTPGPSTRRTRSATSTCGRQTFLTRTTIPASRSESKV